MNQRTLQPTHYEIFGFKVNPVYEDTTGDEEDGADFKLQGKSKKACLGAVKILLDQEDCKYIHVFKVDGLEPEVPQPPSVRGGCE